MKTTLSLTASLLLLVTVMMTLPVNVTAAKDLPEVNTSLTISCAPELQPLITSWVNEFSRNHPDIQIALEQGVADVTGKSGKISVFTEQNKPDGSDLTSFRLLVGREIVVPVVSRANPVLNDLRGKGVTAGMLLKVLTADKNSGWGDLTGDSRNIPVHFYIMEDGFTRSRVAAFLQANDAAMNGFKVEGADGFIRAMAADPLAIGFCRLNAVLSGEAGELNPQIAFLPVDRNGSGKLEFMEDIYGSVAELTRGVWIGKYPKTLSGHLFLSMEQQPEGAAEIACLECVLTSGQESLGSMGVSSLVGAERQSQLDKLTGMPVQITENKSQNNTAGLILIGLVVLLVAGVITDRLVRRRKLAKAGPVTQSTSGAGIFDEAHMQAPGGLFYDKTHTWAFMEADGKVKIGVDDFLQHVTGKISRVEMKSPGDQIRKGEVLCTLVQNGKQLNIHAPVSGVVTEYNGDLLHDSGLINHSPYSGGWIYRIEPGNWLRETGFLTMADKYREWLRGEFTRLRDFFATAPRVSGMIPVALQDGGVMKDHLLEEMAPEVWEEFQTRFIDTSR